MSEKESGDGSQLPTRRSVLQQTAGLGAASLALSQTAVASSGKPEEESESEEMTRAEKAAKEGKEWNEAWIDEDRIGNSTDRTIVLAEPDMIIAPDPGGGDGRREFGDSIMVGGVEFAFEGYVGICEAKITVTALGQSATDRFEDCSEACANRHYDAAAAYVDWTTCIDTDGNISIDAEGCVWEVDDWACGTSNITIQV